MYCIFNCINVMIFQVTGQGRSQIYLAAQLFSSTVANTVRNAMPQCSDTADVISLTDSVFDLLNTSNKLDDKEQRHQFSKISENNQVIINQFMEFMNSARFGYQNKVAFQEGFIVTLKSLIGLFRDLNAESKNEERLISTKRISCDCLDDAFSKIRSNGGGYVVPNPVEVKTHVRNFVVDANKSAFAEVTVLGKMTSDEKFNNRIQKHIPEFIDELLSKPDPDGDVSMPEKMTTEDDQTYARLLQEVRCHSTIENPQDFCVPFDPMLDVNLEYTQRSAEVFVPTVHQTTTNVLDPRNITGAAFGTVADERQQSTITLTTTNPTEIPTVVSDFALSVPVSEANPNMAGATVHIPSIEPTSSTSSPPKKRKKKDVGVEETTWVDKLTRGVLRVTGKWNGKFREFENIFNQFHNSHPDHLSRQPKVVDKLVKILALKEPKLDSRLLKRYVRLRTSIRLRHVIKKYTQEQITIHIPY